MAFSHLRPMKSSVSAANRSLRMAFFRRSRHSDSPAHGIFSRSQASLPLRMAFFAIACMPSFASRDPALITQSSLRSLRSLHYDCTYLSPLLRGSPLPILHCRWTAASSKCIGQPIPQIPPQFPPASLPSRKNAMRRGSEACDREKMPCAGEIACPTAKTPIACQCTHVCRKTPILYVLNWNLHIIFENDCNF